MDIAPIMNESEQSWAKWHDIEPDTTVAIGSTAQHEVIIIPYDGTEVAEHIPPVTYLPNAYWSDMIA